jgi:hypothetical protein
MADIVVFEKAAATPALRRINGMRKLGEVFNSYFMDASLDADEIVNKTIQDLIADPAYDVTYLDPANILSRKGNSGNKYYYKPNDPSAVLKLKGTRDKFESGDGEAVDVMHIAISGGNADLLSAGNYLSTILTDLEVNNPSAGKRKYLLGTITFRRCR